MKTVDLKFWELCDEIDYWKERAKHYEKEYNDLLAENAIQSKERLLDAQKGVANALRFALCIKDNADGSLSIDKKDRKFLAEGYK